jgi:AraC family transcriptional activator of mtrCDE
LISQPVLRISSADLDNLMSTLDVRFVALSECLVSAGHLLELGGIHAPGIHYNVAGKGRIFICDDPPIELLPHTLIIVPRNRPFRIEVAGHRGTRTTLKSVDGRLQTTTKDGVRRFVAGSGEPQVMLICGYFNACYGSSIDLFGALSAPIVERFTAADRLDDKLKLALTELVNQEVGSGAMSSALLKQVIIALLRRSLSSVNLWVERFSMLRDPQIARAFSEMVAHPGAAHTVHSLAQSACLSRSAFMARFTELIGQSPMAILRDLRMRLAAQQLQTDALSIDQVSRSVGYSSRSSFVRAFRRVYDRDPSEYRAKDRSPA